MKAILRQAEFEDCAKIHKMQVSCFMELFEKYKDYETSPATETLEKVQERFKQPFSKYYFIIVDNIEVGAVRIIHTGCHSMRISPIFVLPEYQNMGYAKMAMLELEKMYSDIKLWKLDTIEQEEKLCSFYEKLGYLPTGKRQDIKDNMTIVFYHKSV
ncbi:MAG: GNAT family N-acetyltransferase [Ruminococcus sp.]|nr:GNAT family N-acetyltransferase [Ruminococcus sp.]